MQSEENWDLVIEPRTSLFDINLRDVWRHRDLLMMFVKRDFVAVYKQTLLGPLWYFIQPVLTTLTFTIVFGNIAQISTDGNPKLLFYMAGITLWNYFADCLTRTSDTFLANAGIFGKVYFPRLVVPLSTIISNLIKFSIQLLLFLGFYSYYFIQGANLNPNSAILLFPLLLFMMAGLGLGFGMIISAMTTKYRDLKFLVHFGVQLLMYATPVIYPISAIPDRYRWLVSVNPMSSIIETFKYGFLGSGYFSWSGLIYSFLFMTVTLVIGILIFNKVEKTFMDTV